MPSRLRHTSAYAAPTLLLLAMSAMIRSAEGSAAFVGCFGSSIPLSSQGTYTYQSSGYCQGVCQKLNQPVVGLSGGNKCWCGDELPAADSQTDNSDCNTPCQGYPSDTCGGDGNLWSIYLTGTESNVPNYGGSSGSSASGSAGGSTATSATSAASTPTTLSTTTAPARTHTNSQPTVITSVAPGTTVVVTSPGSSEATAAPPPPLPKKSGGSNVAGIAAGVVVGVVVLAAAIAGLFFWLRHRRRQTAEDEYKRSTQVNDFMRGGEGKPPATGYSNMSDSRLDPQAGQRRNSLGSIADSQDYSRRILTVANPDHS